MSNLSWYDIKTKMKQLIRSFFYLEATRSLVAFTIFSYLCCVFFTSKVKFVGFESAIKASGEKKSIIFSFWHNRLALLPFAMNHVRKKSKVKCKFMSLSSKHGDGKFIGVIAKLFGFENIAGSTQDGRKSSRGIDLSSMRMMLRKIKNGQSLGITPDGPKGPNQKINSQVIEVAKISKAHILPVSYSSSKFIEINSWDKLKIPLPFSTIAFVAGDLIDVSGRGKDYVVDKDYLEKVMNEVQDRSRDMV